MLTPFRCDDVKRLHHDSTTAEGCSQRKAGETPTSFKPTSESKAPAPKRGRGRPRKHPVTPTPALEPQQQPEDLPDSPSPLTSSYSSMPPFNVDNLSVSNAMQEDQTTLTFNEVNMDTSIPPSPTFSLPSRPNNSPASTAIAPESVFADTPGIDGPEPGPSQWHNPTAPRLSSPATHVPTPDSEQPFSPGLTSASLSHLRLSRSYLAEELRESTALVNRLRTRNRVHEANAMVNRAFAVQAQSELGEYRAVLEERRRVGKALVWALGGSVMVILLYVGFCWWFAPEMEYIRRRREEVLRE